MTSLCFHSFLFLFLLVFVSSHFHFFSFLLFLVFISSCYRFFRCFHCWLHLLTSLFLHFCCCYRECYGFETAFLILKRYLLYTPSQHLAQTGFIKASLGLTVQPSRLKGSPPRFEKQTRPICLFKSHSVWQKILLTRFYLCVRGCYELLY